MLFAATLYRIHFNTVPTYTALGGLGQVPQIRGSITVLIQPYHFLFLRIWRSRPGLERFAGSIGLPCERSRYRSGNGRAPARCGAKSRLRSRSSSASGSLQFIVDGSRIDNELVQAERLGFLNYQVASAIKSKRENDLIAQGNLQDTIRRVNELQATYPYRKEERRA